MFATQLTNVPWDAGDSLKDQQKPLVAGKRGPKASNFFLQGICSWISFCFPLEWKAHTTQCHRIIGVQMKKDMPYLTSKDPGVVL